MVAALIRLATIRLVSQLAWLLRPNPTHSWSLPESSLDSGNRPRARP